MLLMRYVIDLLGVAVFAISGVLAAGRKGLDLLGVAVVAVVTAIGGGTLRDLLLDRHPIFWIADPTYLWVIGGATALAVAYVRFWLASSQALLIADAFGLGFFTISGVQITLMTGHPALIAVVMGTITGVAGGVLRDILTGEIPLILRPGRLYATAAIAGATIYVLLARTTLRPVDTALLAMGVTVILRLVAIAYGLALPAVEVPGETEGGEGGKGGRGREE
jgi:uncharacterized membrane protein YeiH